MKANKMFIVALLAVVITTTCALLFFFALYSEGLICAISFSFLLFLALGSLVLFFLRCLLLVSIEAKSAIIRKNKVVLDFPETTLLWRWDKILKQKFVSYNKSGKISMEAEKRLSYTINFEAFKNAEDYIFFYTKATNGQRNVYKFVEFWLCEFNKEKSLELFDDPLDEEQQKMFFNVLKKFFEPYITGSGVTISAASFTSDETYFIPK